jgi:hypothetical protein
MSVAPVRAWFFLGQRGAALLLVAAAVAASCATTPIPSLPGTPGHYDNGEMSFDYPADWPVLAAQVPESCGVIYVLMVLGTGSWSQGTSQPESNGAVRCDIDSVFVPADAVVVRVYWRAGGPAPMCWGNTQANATVGPNAVQKTVDGSVTSWEIRLPGGEFTMPDNPIFKVYTSDPAQLAKAEAMVASFHWGPAAPSYAGLCSPSPAGSPVA